MLLKNLLFLVPFLWTHCPATSNIERDLLETLDQLNTQLGSQLEVHARFNFVQQGINQYVKGRLRIRSDDLDKLVNNTARKLDKFFQQKILALQRIVESAEKEIDGLNYDESLVNNEEDCENYLQKISMVNVYNTPINEKTNRSGVHVAVEAFKCDNSVVRDFEWTGMTGIEKTFAENAKADKYLLRQYIGTYSGLTRLYPAFLWETEPLLSVDLFDPRLRPWFWSAESAPKDILFLLDYSGSVKGQSFHLIKNSIMHILVTLTPNDYFNAIWYNNKREFMLSSCAEDRFIPATTRNKRLFQEFLSKIEEHDQAFLPPAMNMSLSKYLSDEYMRSIQQNQTSGGHQLIFLFTDGIEFYPTEEIRQFKSQNQDRKIRVFGFAIGRGTGEIKALDWTACETQGTYLNVDSISNVRMQSRQHLTKLAKPLAASLKKQAAAKRPVRFSFPYMDTQNEGAVLSLSAPILNRMFTSNGTIDPAESNSFIGVVGVDLSLERLRLMLPNNEQIKSFIIDNNGIVIFHPKLKLPAREIYSIRRTACHVASLKHRTRTRVQFGPVDERIQKLMGHIDSIPTLDILEIEPNFTSAFAAFRNAMIRDECGKTIEDNDKQYRCVRIKNTSFTVGFVLLKNKGVLELDDRVEKTNYEENELVADWVREPSLCSEFLSADGELERFESLVDMAEKKAECLSSAHRSMLSAFSYAISEWRTSWPLLEDNRTCSSNPEPNGFHNLHRASFVEYAPGIVTFYPKCEFAIVQHFFNNRPQILDDNMDTNLLKAIFDIVTRRQIALVGAHFSPQFMSSVWAELLKKADEWQVCKSAKGKCYIVTDEAYVLASFNTKSGVAHFATEEPVLFDQLITMQVIKSSTLIDYQAKCYVRPPKLHQTSSTSSAAQLFSVRVLRRLMALAYSWFTLDLFGDFVADSASPEDNCQFKAPEINEQCVMRYSNLKFQIDKTLVLATKGRKGCVGNVTIVPISGHQLYAVFVESSCKDTQKDAVAEGINKYQLRPIRVPDCNLVKRRVRYRLANTNYNVTYPQEPTPECSHCSMPRAAAVLSVLFVPHLLV